MRTSKSEIEIIRLNLFDGIEHKRALFLNRDFPMHIHHEWCLALIEAGSELFYIDEAEIQLNTNALILIPPYSAHSNRGNVNAFWQYSAIYLNADAVNYINKKSGNEKTSLEELNYYISYDKSLVNRFRKIYNSNIRSLNLENTISMLFCALLKRIPVPDKSRMESSNQTGDIEEVLNYLKLNFYRKITLDQLSGQFRQDKFKFLRRFRSKAGLSPQEYITALRIENTKKLMFSENAIAEIAMESGFYDQSHFTNTFKNYVGLTPNEYRKVCNIFQEKEK